jgi:3-hydroxyacyl-CoA dehydrogenase / 3-hydroxy-2-methylbutyryl-CoA dehydrogenase
MHLEDRSVLVAGGASGLGAATARRLHAGGAHVLVADLDEEHGKEVVAGLGDRAEFARVDVTDAGQVERAVARAAERPGGLRVSVCCAGVAWAERTVGRSGPHSLDAFQTVVAVNLVGTFNVLRHAAAAMAANEPNDGGERGLCVSTASIAAYEGQIGQLAYAASKGGVVAMTLPAARDLASLGVRVCAIAPGVFATPMVAMLPEEAQASLAKAIPFPRRLGRPEEYAELVAHLVANPMLNGEVVRLDGALRMAPR